MKWSKNWRAPTMLLSNTTSSTQTTTTLDSCSEDTIREFDSLVSLWFALVRRILAYLDHFKSIEPFVRLLTSIPRKRCSAAMPFNEKTSLSIFMNFKFQH